MVRVGTFNLNNLFSRFNFEAQVDDVPAEESGGITLRFDRGDVRVRASMGRLVREKDAVETAEIARRIRDVIDADVLAVQEIEHIEILEQFNRERLGGLYPHAVLLEGNDQRLIDVGVLSKLPIGAISSHQMAVHPERPNERVFSRDLLQVEILDARGRKLFNLYNTHLKSHFVPFPEDPIAGALEANERRRRQAETIGRIIAQQERPDGRFVLAGDMNDPPDSPRLAGMLAIDGRPLVNALAQPAETRQAKPETPGQGPGPQSTAWTHRFNPTGAEPPRYELFDQLWVSGALGARFANPTIDRRTKHGGDGSDHDPAWIDLDL
jgi:endonuclease/exonuclease/phosphatase family metal-dependent hydrolase